MKVRKEIGGSVKYVSWLLGNETRNNLIESWKKGNYRDLIYLQFEE